MNASALYDRVPFGWTGALWRTLATAASLDLGLAHEASSLSDGASRGTRSPTRS